MLYVQVGPKTRNEKGESKMAEFTENSVVKSAGLKTGDLITAEDAFNTIVQSGITTNPYGCVSCMNAGVNHPPG
jgi:hypothetical protein